MGVEQDWGTKSHPLDAPTRPAEGGIALERVPGEAEENERVYAASKEHDSYIATDGASS